MKPLMWFAALLLLFSAAMIVSGIGAAGLWIALIAVGIAIVAFGRQRQHMGGQS